MAVDGHDCSIADVAYPISENCHFLYVSKSSEGTVVDCVFEVGYKAFGVIELIFDSTDMLIDSKIMQGEKNLCETE